MVIGPARQLRLELGLRPCRLRLEVVSRPEGEVLSRDVARAAEAGAVLHQGSCRHPLDALEKGNGNPGLGPQLLHAPFRGTASVGVLGRGPLNNGTASRG